MGEPVKSIVPAENVKDYSGIIYWNSFEVILEHWNMSITGSATETWYEYVRDRFGPFDRALFVNCGNGWVERALFQSGTIRSAVGFDINGELLSQAREEALQLGMPSHYVVADCNIFDATTLGKFDLIVNYAAMHRVVYLNRITQQIAEMLNENGIYVALDYVGPHRKQYEWSAWSKVLETNFSLPMNMRSKLVYPHLVTMLAHDPTEAIHSELMMEVVQRHFDLELLAYLGGAIAYSLLYNNVALYNARHTEEGRDLVSRILQVDREFTAEHPGGSLFTFWVGRPKNGRDDGQLRAWQDEEYKRERGAVANDGRYYPPTGLELIYNMIADHGRNTAQFKENVAPRGSTAEAHSGTESFCCCICGHSTSLTEVQAHRELAQCRNCGSTPRFRGLALAVLRYVFKDETHPLTEQPRLPGVSAVGISDSEIYADLLADKLSYRNTFYHKEPLLDLCDPDSVARWNALDLVICSDVLEHTKGPPVVVLSHIWRMLRPKGLAVISAPTYQMQTSVEWYGGARDMRIVQRENKFIVEWETRRGMKYVDYAPVFHGGPGDTLEMRVISHDELLATAQRVGFSAVTLEFMPPLGYDWPLVSEDPTIDGALDGRIVLLWRESW